MKLVIVDDHPMVRKGIKQTLNAELSVKSVHEASNAQDALSLLQKMPEISVLILDINLPDRNGFDVLLDIHRRWPRLPVLVFSIHAEGTLGIRAIKAGASGFLNKTCAPEALVNAVKQLASGATYVSSYLADLLVREISGRVMAASHDQLSDREYQVMCMLATGKSISQIAAALYRSPSTISTYRSRILEKMGVSNNAELTQYAISNQLIE